MDFLVYRSTACQCFSFAVLLPSDPSKNSPSNCHFISIFIGIPRSWYIDLKISPTGPLSPLRRTPLLQRPGLSEEWKQISKCECQFEPPIPSCFFSRLDPAAKALSTKTDFFNAFLSSISQRRSGFPNQISRYAFHRNKVEFTRFTLLFGQMLRGFCKV